MNKTPVSESPLGSLVTIKQGYTFSRSYQGNAEGKWMYVKVADLNSLGNKKYVYRTKNYVDDDVLEKIKATPFPANSIVFPRVGAALKLNNKLLLTEDCVTDDNVIVITVTDEEKCYFEYLYYWFELQDLGRFCNSGAVPVISGKNLKKELVPLPPLDEQKKISRVLSEWDNAIEKTEALISAKEKQFEWLRSYLISSSQTDQTLKFGDFLTESRIPDTTQDPERRLTVRLHLKGVSVRDYRGTESTDATKYFHRKSGQLIYGKQNVFRGSIGIVPSHLDGYSSSQDIPAFDIADNVNSKWLYWYLSRPSFYSWLENFSAGSGSKRLHPKELFKISVDLPTLEDQKRISDSLNLADKEIRLLKKTLKQYRSQKRGLMQKLLTGEWQVGSSQHLSEETYQELSREGVA